MPKKRIYDWDKIGDDYKSGLSLNDLHKKYGISPGYASNMLKKLNIEPHSHGYKMEKEWCKINRAGALKSGRIISIPKHILKKMGFDPEKDLLCKWEISCNKLTLILKYSVQSSNQTLRETEG